LYLSLYVPGHNTWVTGLPSGASAGQRESEERKGPHRDYG
jgi:hypothetical protein